MRMGVLFSVTHDLAYLFWCDLTDPGFIERIYSGSINVFNQVLYLSYSF
ncbi:hypothetical protein F0726_02314 [Acidithiobacillus caldus]|nr:hypothetical protein F0726_02314 [Acidithiobacillus caldus]